MTRQSSSSPAARTWFSKVFPGNLPREILSKRRRGSQTSFIRTVDLGGERWMGARPPRAYPVNASPTGSGKNHLDVRCSMFDVGCWMLDVGCWMLDVGCWMLDVRRWTLDVRSCASSPSALRN